jgi:hypothetical protein
VADPEARRIFPVVDKIIRGAGAMEMNATLQLYDGRWVPVLPGDEACATRRIWDPGTGEDHALRYLLSLRGGNYILDDAALIDKKELIGRFDGVPNERSGSGPCVGAGADRQ